MASSTNTRLCTADSVALRVARDIVLWRGPSRARIFPNNLSTVTFEIETSPHHCPSSEREGNFSFIEARDQKAEQDIFFMEEVIAAVFQKAQYTSHSSRSPRV